MMIGSGEIVSKCGKCGKPSNRSTQF